MASTSDKKATNIDSHDDKKVDMESGKNTDEAKPGKRNPLAFLGLKRVDVEEEDVEDDDIDVDGEGSPTKSSASGLALNRRGVPARKRKRNSLIYGTDDLVSIPARSPKKRGAKPSGTPDKYNDTGKSSEINTPVSSPRKRNTPKRDAASTRSISSTNDDEMLENELESIFSAGKVAMKSIFKEDDSSQSENKVGILDDAHDKKENTQVNNHDGNDQCSGEDEEDDYDADPTDGWERKIRMLNSELAGDNAELAGKETRASRVKANRAFQEMIKNKSPAKSPKKSSPFKENKSLEKSPDKSPVKKKLVFGGSREVGKRTSRMTTSQRSPSKRHVKSDINFIDPMELSTPDKKHAQTLGVALRNLLKLPKAHKWVCYEFFYSNLDQILFEGENDFTVCLRESFPDLKTRRLTRVEWCKIRRLMGKPRRCSAAFFFEERSELMRKRAKIRLLQQRRQNEVSNFKDLPDNIPLQLTIGTRVTARLRSPQEGLFMGAVDAYDTSNNTYRIRFDRPGLGGTHSVRDEEVLSVEPPETVPLSSFIPQRVARPKPPQVSHPGLLLSSGNNTSGFLSPLRSSGINNVTGLTQYGSNYSPQLANDPLLSGSTPKGKVMRMDGQVGGYPIKFLEQIVRLSKCLKMKRERISQLRDLNTQGEKRKSFGEFITGDFQRRYASNVIDLSNINKDLNEHIKTIQEFTQEFAPEIRPTISLPNIIRDGCQEDAYDLVNKSNSHGEYNVDNPKVLGLISSFTSLMLHIKQLSDGERNSYELEALQETLAEVKNSINTQNVNKFENCVEVHMKHIQSGLSQLGNLHAFMKSASSGAPTPTKNGKQEEKYSQRLYQSQLHNSNGKVMYPLSPNLELDMEEDEKDEDDDIIGKHSVAMKSTRLQASSYSEKSGHIKALSS